MNTIMPARIILLFVVLLTGFTSKAQHSRKFDVYGALHKPDEMARLDNFAIELQNEPVATAYIITYGGSKSTPSVAKTRANFAKNYLVNTRGISGDRIVTMDGGLQQLPGTELWIVPTGATPPQASPTVASKSVKVKVKGKK
jgi:hypothetical protein